MQTAVSSLVVHKRLWTTNELTAGRHKLRVTNEDMAQDGNLSNSTQGLTD